MVETTRVETYVQGKGCHCENTGTTPSFARYCMFISSEISKPSSDLVKDHDDVEGWSMNDGAGFSEVKSKVVIAQDVRYRGIVQTDSTVTELKSSISLDVC